MNLSAEHVWLLFPLLVTALAIAMLLTHRRSWRALQNLPLDADEHDYHYRRYRRRVQASSLLALIGPALFVGHRIPPRELPWLFIGYWTVVILVTICIGLLALGDALATGRHFSHLRRERTTARAELQGEIARARASMAGDTSDTPRSE